MSRFIFVFAMVMVFVPCAVRAEEQLMELFPKQRAEHQAKMDNNEGKYLARGHAYVDHMYSAGGEEPMAEMEDLELDDSNTVAVDAGEIAKLITQGVPKFPN